MSAMDPFDLTTMNEIESFMQKYSKRYPQFSDEILWQLFLVHRGDRKKIKKHLKELAKTCTKSQQKITWEKIKGVSDDLYQKMFPKKETLLQKEEEDITQQWSQI